MKINNIEYNVDKKLKGFNIQAAASTNVSFFGSSKSMQVVIQFKSGFTYIYFAVDAQTITDMYEAKDISAFVNTRLKGFTTEKLRKMLITTKS